MQTNLGLFVLWVNQIFFYVCYYVLLGLFNQLLYVNVYHIYCTLYIHVSDFIRNNVDTYLPTKYGKVVGHHVDRNQVSCLIRVRGGGGGGVG